MNLYIYNYNNYYNRTVKKAGDNISDYESYLYYGPITGVYGFTPGNGVDTVQILGSNLHIYDGQGNYLIAHDPATNKIDSRWFIIDSNRTRAGQWQLTLHRDLMADYFDSIKSSPVFIEKATLKPTDALIFNKEDMTFNQIKTNEVLLKDKSQCPWIVGYYAKNADHGILAATIPDQSLNETYDILIDTPITQWEYNGTHAISPKEIQYRIYGLKCVVPTGLQAQNGYIAFDSQGDYTGWTRVSNPESTLDFDYKAPTIGSELGNIMEQSINLINSQFRAYATYYAYSEEEYYLSLNGKLVKDSSGDFWRISLKQTGTLYSVVDIPSGSLYETFANTILPFSTSLKGTPNAKSFKIAAEFPQYTMSAQKIIGDQISYDFGTENQRLTTIDAPYNIFAMPVANGVSLFDSSLNQAIASSNKEISIKVANDLIKNMGSNLYDIQLLPYCPLDVPEYFLIDVLTSKAYSVVKDQNENPISFILNIPYARFSKTLMTPISIPTTDPKIENECNMYKLCSPNWSSEFQFSAAKNGGVQFFSIDCEYKPFQPYIHINPNFGNLYGRDFDDARGLILSGDFSLPQIKDEWQQYQINNKNYQQMFDRQIQNMEVQQKYGKVQDIANAITGSVSASVTGGMMGSLGGPVGTAVGAIAGGVMSAGAGIADIAINNQLRNEAIDYTKDNFGYQLGNIQALPYTLTKVSSFNNNNKIFPVLEFYTCTDREKDALKQKIAYNGMTAMVIGKPEDYISNVWSSVLSDGTPIKSKGYFKGQLIRLENPELTDDYHVFNAIAGELYKGVYIE